MTNIWSLSKELSRPKIKITIKAIAVTLLYLLVMAVLFQFNLISNMSSDSKLGLFVAFPAVMAGLVVPVLLAINQESNWVKNNYQLAPIPGWQFILSNILTTVVIFILDLIFMVGLIYLVFVSMGMESLISFSWNWTEVFNLFGTDLIYPIALATAIAFVDLIYRTYERLGRFSNARVLVIALLGTFFVGGSNLTNDYFDDLNFLGGNTMNYVILPITAIAMFIANIWLYNRFVESKK